jgi:hypothetical protein
MAQSPAIEIAVRIPTQFVTPEELFTHLPEGYYAADNFICNEQGALAGIYPMPPDTQFETIFRRSYRVKPQEKELRLVKDYKLNLCLCGPGGSLDAAWSMMQAASAVLHASQSGIFIDNSGLSHGASQWIELTEDGSIEAMSFAFINLIRGLDGIFTFGMNAFGLPDLELGYSDVDEVGSQLVDLLQHVCASQEHIQAGDWVGGDECPRYQATLTAPRIENRQSIMFNPHGKLRMTRLRDIAERN